MWRHQCEEPGREVSDLVGLARLNPRQHISRDVACGVAIVGVLLAFAPGLDLAAGHLFVCRRMVGPVDFRNDSRTFSADGSILEISKIYSNPRREITARRIGYVFRNVFED